MNSLNFDLRALAFKDNPFPKLARLRAAGPVVRLKLPLVGAVWAATTYDAVSELLRDHATFVQKPAHAGRNFFGRWQWLMPRTMLALTESMIRQDEPEHRRLRSLVEQAFLRQSVSDMRPRLEQIADELLDQIADDVVRPSGIDLIQRFARPFPLAVICELLGLPVEDRPMFMRWGGAFSVSRAWDFVRLLRTIRHLFRYLREQFRQCRAAPRPGLLSALIHAEVDGQRLTEDELLAMAFLLLVAGHETTVHLIADSVLTLFDHPHERAELTSAWTGAMESRADESRADASLPESAVEELLRYVSSVQFSKPRFAVRDLEFQGQSIARGEIVIAVLASANSDPAQFPNPETLDLRRSPNRHVAFGAGIHFCLGAQLARLELAVALERLLTRFPTLRLAIPRTHVRWKKSLGMRVLHALPVTTAPLVQ